MAGTSFALGVKAGTLPKPETLFAPPSALVQKTTEAIGSCGTKLFEFGATKEIDKETTNGVTKKKCTEEVHQQQLKEVCAAGSSIPPEKGRPINARTAQTVWSSNDGKIVETVAFDGVLETTTLKHYFPLLKFRLKIPLNIISTIQTELAKLMVIDMETKLHL